MPKYQIINKSNAFDDANNAEFASEDAADARARELLKNFPNSVVQVVQVLKEYTAKVSVTASEPQTPVTLARIAPQPDRLATGLPGRYTGPARTSDVAHQTPGPEMAGGFLLPARNAE